MQREKHSHHIRCFYDSDGETCGRWTVWLEFSKDAAGHTAGNADALPKNRPTMEARIRVEQISKFVVNRVKDAELLTKDRARKIYKYILKNPKGTEYPSKRRRKV